MMRSKSFNTQKLRKIGRNGSRKVERLSNLCRGTIEDVFQMEGMQSPGKFENVRKMGQEKMVRGEYPG